MAEELRKTGISVVGNVPWGTHLCHFYETQEDLLDILIPYFKTGLESNEFCVWVVSDPLGEEEARNAFRQAVPEADRYLAAGHIEIYAHTVFPSSRQQTSPTGQIEIVPHTEWYLKGGTFIAERVTDGWNEKLAEALAKGYVGLRANGNVAWLTEENRKDFFQYEKTLDEKLSDQRMIVLCSYPLSTSSAAEIFDVVNTHQLAILRRRGHWEVLETPELMQAKQEIKRLNEELEQRVIERTRELAAANEELRKEIAERKGAEEALRRSEDRIRLIIDTVPALIHTGLPDGSLDFFNQRWLEYVGLSLDDLLGWKWTAAIHPDDVVAMVNGWRAALARGEPFEHESRVRRADGEYRWMFHRDVPLRDERGPIVKWYASSIDIEDRKRAEEALRQSEDRIRLIIDTIPVMAWSLRPDGVVDFLNQRWMDYAGLSLEQYVKDPTGPIHPDDIPRVIEKWHAQMAIGEGYDDEMRLRRADGTYRWFLVRTDPLRDEQGKLVRWYGVSTDIEDRKRAEEKLTATTEQLRALSARLQMAKEEESTRIARELHDELGSALTSLKWNLELLEKDDLRSVDGVGHSRKREQIKDMAALIDSTINSVRRISAELRPSMLDDLGLVAAVQSYLLQFQERAGIVTRFESSVDEVELTPPQSTALFRIFQEALTNVLRHSQATKVNIRISRQNGQFVLTISDNGRGITKSEKSSVLSLGLLGMQERARLVGGEIDIATREEGGTVITVRVPIARDGDLSSAVTKEHMS
ncbi:MAG: hypothetical protein DMF72_15690 [Acidobacteria bacterium]|nr:MAG: hypothetical protein DMF72_15690 [Acidobacteriota bacterium]